MILKHIIRIRCILDGVNSYIIPASMEIIAIFQFLLSEIIATNKFSMVFLVIILDPTMYVWAFILATEFIQELFFVVLLPEKSVLYPF